MTYDWIKTELAGLYGTQVLQEFDKLVGLYALYDGSGQDWAVKTEDGYTPTKQITNLTKKLINDESRFMVGRPPEIRIVPDDAANQDAAAEIEGWLTGVLDANRWQQRLLHGVRDCFVGKRVALKLGMTDNGPTIRFAPSLEFVFETEDDDLGTLKKVIFFYGQTDPMVTDKARQRIWRQKYWMDGGKCLLDEGVYDGYGNMIEQTRSAEDTKLPFVPVYIIINGGLSGDLSGESDVAELADNQAAYNHLKSDDIDALKYNMFPQRVFVDASQQSMDSVVIAPNAMVDLETDSSAVGKQASASVLESHFSYDGRFENAINRVKNDMYDLISAPNVSLEQLKGWAASGESLRKMYWPLICRCEEKWAEWDGALRWMVERLMEMARLANAATLPEIPHAIRVDHLYPIPDDEEAERERDLREVAQMARSRKNYITKWQPDADDKGELKQIALEKRLLEDAYISDAGDELRRLQG